MNEAQNSLETPNEAMETTTSDTSTPLDTEVIIEVNPDDSAFQSEEITTEQMITQLLQQIAQQSEEIDGYKKRYITLAAEFDNYRKRTQREQKELEKQVKRKTIIELLSVVDNFERARTQLKSSTDGEIIHKSYQSVYKSFADSLKRLGVSAMRPEGQLFDPNYHEAMLREYTNDHPEGTILEELVRGYLLEDQVLRHSMVKVAAPQESVIPSEQEPTDPQEAGSSPD